MQPAGAYRTKRFFKEKLNKEPKATVVICRETNLFAIIGYSFSARAVNSDVDCGGSEGD